MPIILRCNKCKKEEEDNPSALKGTNWLVKGLIGGTLVLCPDCRHEEDQKDSDRELRRLAIDSKVRTYKEKLEKEITLKKVRKDREKFVNQMAKALRGIKGIKK